MDAPSPSALDSDVVLRSLEALDCSDEEKAKCKELLCANHSPLQDGDHEVPFDSMLNMLRARTPEEFMRACAGIGKKGAAGESPFNMDFLKDPASARLTPQAQAFSDLLGQSFKLTPTCAAEELMTPSVFASLGVQPRAGASGESVGTWSIIPAPPNADGAGAGPMGPASCQPAGGVVPTGASALDRFDTENEAPADHGRDHRPPSLARTRASLQVRRPDGATDLTFQDGQPAMLLTDPNALPALKYHLSPVISDGLGFSPQSLFNFFGLSDNLFAPAPETAGSAGDGNMTAPISTRRQVAVPQIEIGQERGA